VGEDRALVDVERAMVQLLFFEEDRFRSDLRLDDRRHYGSVCWAGQDPIGIVAVETDSATGKDRYLEKRLLTGQLERGMRGWDYASAETNGCRSIPLGITP
jgi:hypothetical protein